MGQRFVFANGTLHRGGKYNHALPTQRVVFAHRLYLSV
jgi:hypothetical protein